MKKICLNNRDEMIMLFVDNIAYIMADGNYTKICYIGGMTTVLSFGISKVETLVSASYADGEVSPFVRLGRSAAAIKNHQIHARINLFSRKKSQSLIFRQKTRLIFLILKALT